MSSPGGSLSILFVIFSRPDTIFVLSSSMIFLISSVVLTLIGFSFRCCSRVSGAFVPISCSKSSSSRGFSLNCYSVVSAGIILHFSICQCVFLSTSSFYT